MDYGYGAAVGQGYQHAFTHLGESIAKSIAEAQKRKQIGQGMQSYLDMAKRFQLPDPKTGKPRNVFKDDDIMTIQRMLDSHNYAAAGAQEAALGIGKGMVDRWNTAAAKQQAGIDKQNRLQQLIQQGPITATGPQGQPYIGNPNTGTWGTNTAKPQNQMGMTAEEQLNMQRGINKDANAAQLAQFKAQQQAKLSQTKIFSAFLKSNGINSPTDLFDPSVQRAGTVDPTGGQFVNDPHQDPTHVQFYHEDPETDDQGNVKLNKQGNPVGGETGVTLPLPTVVDLQNAAASMAGPQAMQALQWLRENPDSKHAAAVAAEIANRMGKIDMPPTPETFNPSPPTYAPEQAPAALNQQGAQPVTGSATEPLPGTAPPTDAEDDTGD